MKQIDNKKISFLRKILKAGYETEQEISQIKLEDLVKKDSITLNDIKEILNLQEAIKKKTLFEYLLIEDKTQPKDRREEIKNVNENRE